jgi:hypothetical protein
MGGVRATVHLRSMESEDAVVPARTSPALCHVALVVFADPCNAVALEAESQGKLNRAWEIRLMLDLTEGGRG